jgi:hypothetical protein
VGVVILSALFTDAVSVVVQLGQAASDVEVPRIRVGSGNLQWPRRGGLKWPHLASVVVGVDVA